MRTALVTYSLTQQTAIFPSPGIPLDGHGLEEDQRDTKGKEYLEG